MELSILQALLLIEKSRKSHAKEKKHFKRKLSFFSF